MTRVIGGRYREDLAGVEVRAATADAATIGDAERELVLPVSWIFATRSWRPKGYSVMQPERPGLRAGPAWRTTCLFCHNTAPALSLALGPLHGPGAPTYQGTGAGQLLPAARAWRCSVTDGAELGRQLVGELGRLAGGPVTLPPLPQQELLARVIRSTHALFGASDLVELGIGF